MRSVALVGALLAVGSLATPVVEKRAIEWVTEVDIVTKVAWVTVHGPAPTTQAAEELSPAALNHHVKHTHHGKKPKSSPASAPSPSTEPAAPPPPPPPPSSTPAPPPPPPSETPTPPPPPPPPSPSPSPKPSSAPAPPPAPKPSTVSAPAPASGSFEDAVTSSHNSIRSQHGVGPLAWDAALAASAQALADGCQFVHNVDLGPASNYGQNIASGSWPGSAGDDAAAIKYSIVDLWYTPEAKAFQSMGLYGNPIPDVFATDFDAYGHFTQEVWKSTTKVGCAVQSCSNLGGFFAVCNYNPAGNYGNEFAANVFQ